MIDGEDVRSVSSTFYVIRAAHAQTGRQPAGDLPAPYPGGHPARRSDAGREVGLHGNDADRLSLDELTEDRHSLSGRAGRAVTGIRYHYLRALYHETLPMLEQAGFTYDTTLAFAEQRGVPLRLLVPVPPVLPGGGAPARPGGAAAWR